MKFPNGIELKNIDGGLLVRQHNKAYLAKHWKLTAQTIELVESALSSGLTWMIRDGHPQAHSLWPKGQGRVYLAFSPTQQRQWSLAIDTFNERSGDYGVAVFNGKYHEQFRNRLVDFNFEKRNKVSGHMVVKRSKVLPTIELLRNLDHDVLYLRRSESDLVGFGTEYDIQKTLLQNWSCFALSKSFSVYADEFPVDSGRTSRRVDIVARNRNSGDWLIIELKRAEAKLEAIEQIKGYLLALAKRDDFAFGSLTGALILERVPESVRALAQREGVHAYEIGFPYQLQRVV